MSTSGEAPVRKARFLRTIQAVAWSFIGIRRNSDYQEDIARLNIVHIIIVAIAAVILLVLGLVALVHWVVQ